MEAHSETYYDYTAHGMRRVTNPAAMDLRLASRFVPQTPRAQRLIADYMGAQGYTADRAIKVVNDIIFQHNPEWEK